MGTRSLTFVHDEDDTPIVCIYRQFDGYFDGAGQEILDFLRGGRVVNGFTMKSDVVQFNGAGDLAARLITQFKGGDSSAVGNIYIEPADRPDDEEYTYRIRCKTGLEPWLEATCNWQDFTVQGFVSEFTWPDTDDDGYYIDAAADGPLTNDQRSLLFALFNEVHGDASDSDARHEFTRSVLGRGAPVSWSSEGGITYAQASRLIDVLKFMAKVVA